eukprot:1171871-Alexandrium_andersonii.AAC.1
MDASVLPGAARARTRTRETARHRRERRQRADFRMMQRLVRLTAASLTHHSVAGPLADVVRAYVQR